MNITSHVLKPKHQVLTPREKEKLLKKYNLEEKQVSSLSTAYTMDNKICHVQYMFFEILCILAVCLFGATVYRTPVIHILLELSGSV